MLEDTGDPLARGTRQFMEGTSVTMQEFDSEAPSGAPVIA